MNIFYVRKEVGLTTDTGYKPIDPLIWIWFWLSLMFGYTCN